MQTFRCVVTGMPGSIVRCTGSVHDASPHQFPHMHVPYVQETVTADGRFPWLRVLVSVLDVHAANLNDWP